MRVVVVGRGVIGVTYGLILKAAGHEVQHLMRDEPDEGEVVLDVQLLDGRVRPPVSEALRYALTSVTFAPEEVDLVFVSVPATALKGAIEALRQRGLDRRILLMGGVWSSRDELDAIIGHRDYVLGYPIAGGRRDEGRVESVLFDSVRLEAAGLHAEATHAAASAMFRNCGLQVELVPRMLEWLWLHQAVNAGIISAIASQYAGGPISDVVSGALADPRVLRRGIANIRQCLRVVRARGVRLHHHLRDVAPYVLVPKGVAARIMIVMFRRDVLSRRIMELHHNLDDILALMSEVQTAAHQLGIAVPGLDRDLARAHTALAHG